MKHKIPEKLFVKRGREIEAIFRCAVWQALWRHKQPGQVCGRFA
jgi:hypothetical protein